MAKKTEAVAIKPKKRVARVSDADKIEALGELVGQLWMRIGHLENWSKDMDARDKAANEEYNAGRERYEKEREEWLAYDKRYKDAVAKVAHSFTARIKWLLTGRV